VEAQLMLEKDPGRGEPISPREWHKLLPFEPAAASDRLGWTGLEAASAPAAPSAEVDRPPLTHHTLVLFSRPPDELELCYEGVNRLWPPPAGAVSVVPAGIPSHWRWRGTKGSMHVYLEPELVGRVVAEVFDRDPARLVVPPLDNLDLPALRATMAVVAAELASGGAGGPLAAESLANVLAVHLLRHVSAPDRLQRGRDGALPRGRLRAVVEYIEEHLDGAPTLEQLAAVARLSPYHFARQFKAATGLPPHQYVILRRVERAKQLLQGGTDLSLAEVALHAGFSGQSVFCLHFKRLVGVTPRQFRMSARIA
jgi:AraC family transcriptional regulator